MEKEWTSLKDFGILEPCTKEFVIAHGCKKPVELRWLLRRKPKDGNEKLVKARIVAQQVNLGGLISMISSWRSIWMTKWTYNEEFRPVWARYWKEPFWRKLHPCRCTHGPFPCTNKAVRYYNFLCRQCSVRTRVGEIQCHCFCTGCRVFPVHDPEVNWYTKEKTPEVLTSRTVDEDEPPLDDCGATLLEYGRAS